VVPEAISRPCQTVSATTGEPVVRRPCSDLMDMLRRLINCRIIIIIIIIIINRNGTNNILESFHAALRRRIQVSHPNLFTFLGHLQHVTTESMHDLARLTNGLSIRMGKLVLITCRVADCMREI